MKIVLARDSFQCAVLEPGDLDIFFNAKKVLYEDAGIEFTQNPHEVLAAMEESGPSYFELIFTEIGAAAFVLLNEQREIVGSAELLCGERSGKAEFQAAHIHSALRGRRLVDLFYEAREAHVRKNTSCTQLFLWTKPDNQPSKNAAIRNGFTQNGLTESGNPLFIKSLER